jgi:hypothetical protein
MEGFSGFDLVSGQYSALVAPGESGEVRMKFAENIDNGVMVKVSDSIDGDRIVGAQVVLSNSEGYNESITTLADGIAYLPLTSTPIVAGTYNIEITATGYNTYTGTVDINGLEEEQVILTAS